MKSFPVTIIAVYMIGLSSSVRADTRITECPYYWPDDTNSSKLLYAEILHDGEDRWAGTSDELRKDRELVHSVNHYSRESRFIKAVLACEYDGARKLSLRIPGYLIREDAIFRDLGPRRHPQFLRVWATSIVE